MVVYIKTKDVGSLLSNDKALRGRLSEAKAGNVELCFNASCGKKKLISFVYFF